MQNSVRPVRPYVVSAQMVDSSDLAQNGTKCLKYSLGHLYIHPNILQNPVRPVRTSRAQKMLKMVDSSDLVQIQNITSRYDPESV